MAPTVVAKIALAVLAVFSPVPSGHTKKKQTEESTNRMF